MKGADFLSERMIFGLLIIGGYLGFMTALCSNIHIPSANLNLISQGVGALGTAVGVIASLSATVASQAPPSPQPEALKTAP
jgi:hypothetical protein